MVRAEWDHWVSDWAVGNRGWLLIGNPVSCEAMRSGRVCNVPLLNCASSYLSLLLGGYAIEHDGLCTVCIILSRPHFVLHIGSSFVDCILCAELRRSSREQRRFCANRRTW